MSKKKAISTKNLINSVYELERCIKDPSYFIQEYVKYKTEDELKLKQSILLILKELSKSPAQDTMSDLDKKEVMTKISKVKNPKNTTEIDLLRKKVFEEL